MLKEISFEFEKSPSKRGDYDCITPVVRLLTKVREPGWQFAENREVSYVFDSGAHDSLISIPFAESFHIQFVQSLENSLHPPVVKGGELKGYWGEIQITLHSRYVTLKCFFYEPIEDEGVPTIQAEGMEGVPVVEYGFGHDPGLDEFVRSLSSSPRAETDLELMKRKRMPLLGMAGFIEKYEVQLGDGRTILRMREKRRTMWERVMLFFTGD
jgi:hypothetical protein